MKKSCYGSINDYRKQQQQKSSDKFVKSEWKGMKNQKNKIIIVVVYRN